MCKKTMNIQLPVKRCDTPFTKYNFGKHNSDSLLFNQMEIELVITASVYKLNYTSVCVTARQQCVGQLQSINMA